MLFPTIHLIVQSYLQDFFSMSSEIKKTLPQSFGFTHPNKAINDDLDNISNVCVVSAGSITDEESLERNFENVQNSIPLNNANIVSSDLALNGAFANEELTTSSSEGTNNSTGSSGTFSSADLSILDTKKTKGPVKPLFTESFDVQKKNTIYTTDTDSLNGDGDMLSLISSTTVSQILDLNTFTFDSNISSAIKKAVQDVEPSKAPAKAETITETKDDNGLVMNSRLTMIHEAKRMDVGTSRELEKFMKVKTKSKPIPRAKEALKKELREVMDVKAIGNASRGFAQLLFISIIKFCKSLNEKTLTEKQFQKQISDSEGGSALNIRDQFLTGLKSMFTSSSKEIDEYKRAIGPLFKELNTIFANQKLYIDIQHRGVRPFGAYAFRTWQSYEYNMRNDSRLSSIIKGDGWFQRRVPPYKDFKVITRNSEATWSKELFEPIAIFPELKKVAEFEDQDTLLNYFSPLLDVLVIDEIEKKRLKYEKPNPSSLKDILESKISGNRKKQSAILAQEVKTYVYNHYDKIKIKASDIRRSEARIRHTFFGILEAVVNGYIEAFNHVDCFSTLDIHGKDECYIKMVDFYKKCPVIDLGHYLLQAICPPKLSKRVQKLLLRGNSSVEVMEDIIERNIFNMDTITLGYLRLTVAFIQSTYITKYILRRLLFWVDNTETSLLMYTRKYSWFKPTRNFHDQITVAIRDQAISFLEKKSEN